MSITVDGNYVTAHEAGSAGRPLSPANRRRKLKLHYINMVGEQNLTPAISEQIQTATELTCLAAEARAQLRKKGASVEDINAIVKLENTAARAITRLHEMVPSSKPATILDAINAIEAKAVAMTPETAIEDVAVIHRAVEGLETVLRRMAAPFKDTTTA